MTEHPYWPVTTVRAVANGFIVHQSPDYSRDATLSSMSETYVFNTWDECSDFLRVTTCPTRPGPPQ